MADGATAKPRSLSTDTGAPLLGTDRQLFELLPILYVIGRFLAAWHPPSVRLGLRWLHRICLMVLLCALFVLFVVVLVVQRSVVPPEYFAAILLSSICGLLVYLPSPVVYLSVVHFLNTGGDFFAVLRRCLQQPNHYQPLRRMCIALGVFCLLTCAGIGGISATSIYINSSAFTVLGISRQYPMFVLLMTIGWLGYCTFVYCMYLLAVLFYMVELDVRATLQRVRSAAPLDADAVSLEVLRLQRTTEALSGRLRVALLCGFVGTAGSSLAMLYAQLFSGALRFGPVSLALSVSLLAVLFLWVLLALLWASRIAAAADHLAAALAHRACAGADAVDTGPVSSAAGALDAAACEAETFAERVNALVLCLMARPLGVTLVGVRLSLPFVTGALSTYVSLLLIIVQKAL